MGSKWDNIQEVKNFREYLRIPSVHPNIDYDGCLKFLRKQAEELGLPLKIFFPEPKNPVVIITWVGTNPSLPSVLLNSHMDVVPVFPESWIYPPFDAHITEDGKIYARGAQDMKCIAVQYIEAVRRMKKNNKKLRRTIHLCFVPDEEIGGEGMKTFITTDDFKALNVGVTFDEGMASPTNDYVIYNGERIAWDLIITCSGHSGHGSSLIGNTAGEKIRVVIDKFIDFRTKEKAKLNNNPNLTIGDVTTVNLTKIHGGIQTNVIPESLKAVFDIRIAIDVNYDDFYKMIRGWCDEAGEGVTIEFEYRDDKVEITKLDDSNPFWVAFKRAADKLNLKMLQRIFPGGTDSRYIRGIGLPAFGFSPMVNTPILLHDNNEYLQADVFLKGIEIYEKLIAAVANVK